MVEESFRALAKATHDNLLVDWLLALDQHELLDHSLFDSSHTFRDTWITDGVVNGFNGLKFVVNKAPVFLEACKPLGEAINTNASCDLHVLGFVQGDTKLVANKSDDLLSAGKEFGPANIVDGIDQTVIHVVLDAFEEDAFVGISKNLKTELLLVLLGDALL